MRTTLTLLIDWLVDRSILPRNKGNSVDSWQYLKTYQVCNKSYTNIIKDAAFALSERYQDCGCVVGYIHLSIYKVAKAQLKATINILKCFRDSKWECQWAREVPLLFMTVLLGSWCELGHLYNFMTRLRTEQNNVLAHFFTSCKIVALCWWHFSQILYNVIK